VGFASFVLYEVMYCGSVGIFTRPNGGYRLVYPTRKVGERNIEVYYPINRHIGQVIEEVIVKKYEEVTKEEHGRYCSNDALLG